MKAKAKSPVLSPDQLPISPEAARIAVATFSRDETNQIALLLRRKDLIAQSSVEARKNVAHRHLGRACTKAVATMTRLQEDVPHMFPEASELQLVRKVMTPTKGLIQQLLKFHHSVRRLPYPTFSKLEHLLFGKIDPDPQMGLTELIGLLNRVHERIGRIRKSGDARRNATKARCEAARLAFALVIEPYGRPSSRWREVVTQLLQRAGFVVPKYTAKPKQFDVIFGTDKGGVSWIKSRRAKHPG